MIEKKQRQATTRRRVSGITALLLRKRKNTLFAFLTSFAVALATSAFLAAEARSRKGFTSQVIAGYRCRCTLSLDWKTQTDRDGVTSLVEDYDYTYKPSPSPVHDWIIIHLFRQSPFTVNTNMPPPSLLIGNNDVQPGSIFLQIKDGYPERNFSNRMHNLVKHHLRIDACNATVVRYDYPIPLAGTLHENLLYVCTPNYSHIYVIGITSDSRYSDRMDHEMEEIIASFHIEKTAITDAPAGAL